MSDKDRLGKSNHRPYFDGFGDSESGYDEWDYINFRPASKELSMNAFAADMWDTIDLMGNLLLSKQEDYGPLNISRAPGGPLNGLRVRIYDKISRINNLIDSGQDPKHESLRDSFIDLANYGIIALMVLDGTWPQLEEN
jgi:hypothetical protein